MIDDLWYKNAIFYCLSVGTYMDANGDGIGDFKGLLRRLDYLQGLGITAIWLMPFQPSPGKDDGHDISDYYGVDPRLAPMLGGDRRRLELAYSLMCTLPGTPVIRYGDEIGMGDNLDLPERNCARTPMQWSTESQAGFTKSDQPASPVIADGAYGYQHVNVAKQRRDNNSITSLVFPAR